MLFFFFQIRKIILKKKKRVAGKNFLKNNIFILVGAIFNNNFEKKNFCNCCEYNFENVLAFNNLFFFVQKKYFFNKHFQIFIVTLISF